MISAFFGPPRNIKLSLSGIVTRVSFALDRNCWECAIWFLNSTVAELASSPFPFQACFEAVTVECSNHLQHTQQFLSNAKLTLLPPPVTVALIRFLGTHSPHCGGHMWMVPNGKITGYCCRFIFVLSLTLRSQDCLPNIEQFSRSLID